MIPLQKTIDRKLILLTLADEIGVSEACIKMGYSRDSYYRIKKLYDTGGLLAIQNINRNKPIIKNRLNGQIEKTVIKTTFENPCWGQQRISGILNKKGVFISASGVRNVWQRYNMETLEQRLKALETKIAQDKITLTKTQSIALNRKRKSEDDGLWVETEYPGDMGIQDIYCVGKSNEGGANIYQQTFMDSYSKICFVNLFIETGRLEAINILRHKVLPFYKRHGISLHRIDTTEEQEKYLSRTEWDKYQDYLKEKNIAYFLKDDYSVEYIKIFLQFNNTIQNEFYSRAFRKKTYPSIANLQQDLDKWISYYNNTKLYSGKYCYGKTPMQAFYDSLHLVKTYE